MNKFCCLTVKEKPYQCSLCDNGVAHNNLKSHTKNHSRESRSYTPSMINPMPGSSICICGTFRLHIPSSVIYWKVIMFGQNVPSLSYSEINRIYYFIYCCTYYLGNWWNVIYLLLLVTAYTAYIYFHSSGWIIVCCFHVRTVIEVCITMSAPFLSLPKKEFSGGNTTLRKSGFHSTEEILFVNEK